MRDLDRKAKGSYHLGCLRFDADIAVGGARH